MRVIEVLDLKQTETSGVQTLCHCKDIQRQIGNRKKWEGFDCGSKLGFPKRPPLRMKLIILGSPNMIFVNVFSIRVVPRALKFTKILVADLHDRISSSVMWPANHGTVGDCFSTLV